MNSFQNQNTGERPDFNMAVLFLVSLNNSNNNCDIAKSEVNLVMAARILENIWLSFKYKIKTQADKVLFAKSYKTYLEDIDNSFRKINQILLTKTANVNMGIVEIEISTLRENLYDLLWAEHLIFPEKFKMTYEEEIEADFK
jgi:hypothetical protein